MNLTPKFLLAVALIVVGMILIFVAGWVGLVLGIIAILAAFVVLTRGRRKTV